MEGLANIWLSAVLFALLGGHTYSDTTGYSFVSAECARKGSTEGGLSDIGDHESKAPGVKPTKHFIQTTFIHRDVNDEDKSYGQLVAEQLHRLIGVLKQAAFVTIDNENLDCSTQEFHRCREYPLESPFHFLIVEDSVRGAAVYSLDRKPNSEHRGAVEIAILDALSRHSPHPLVNYASPESSSAVGFVRRLSSNELQEFSQKNSEVLRTRKGLQSPFSVHSPFELSLANERVVELRKPPEPTPRALRVLSGSELSELIDDSTEATVLFCLFWTNVNSASAHVFELWSRASETEWDAAGGHHLPLLSSVACHEEVEVCKAFGISHQQRHVIYAFREGKRVASLFAMGGAVEFYVQWIDRVLLGAPLHLQTPEDADSAKLGIIRTPAPYSQLQRRAAPAVTIGKFHSENGGDLLLYKRVAAMLAGRYLLLYSIDEQVPTTSLSTYRPLELVESERVSELTGEFTYKALLEHITGTSLPNVLDIGRGFTSSYLLAAEKRPILLFLYDDDSNPAIRHAYHELASRKHSYREAWSFTEINLKNTVNLEKLMDQLKLRNSKYPILCIVQKEAIRCNGKLSADNKLEVYLRDPQQMTNEVKLLPKMPHPFTFIQAERLNEIFGAQEVELLPEPVLVSGQASTFDRHHHDFANLDMSQGISGCPMMAHLQQPRDEL